MNSPAFNSEVRSSRDYKIVLLVESSAACGRQFLEGIIQYAQSHTKWTFFHIPPLYGGSIDYYMSEVQKLEPSGIIMRDTFGFEQIARLGKPMVVLRANYEEQSICAHSVATDSRAIASMAAEHLLDRDFRSFAFCGCSHIPWSAARQEWFERILHGKGFTVSVYNSDTGDPSLMSNTEQTQLIDWLRTLPPSTALFACNDARAKRVIDACRAAQINIPTELAILGVDNDKLICEMSNPSLSSIQLNFDVAGYLAAEKLNQTLENGPAAYDSIVVSPICVEERTTTNLTAIKCPAVAAAIQFIRNHSNQQLSVTEVAAEAATPRRTLEKLFQQFAGESIYSMIQHERLKRIETYLIKTNMTVAEISHAMAFSDPNALTRFFTKCRNMNPTYFRKRHRLQRVQELSSEPTA